MPEAEHFNRMLEDLEEHFLAGKMSREEYEMHHRNISHERDMVAKNKGGSPADSKREGDRNSNDGGPPEPYRSELKSLYLKFKDGKVSREVYESENERIRAIIMGL